MTSCWTRRTASPTWSPAAICLGPMAGLAAFGALDTGVDQPARLDQGDQGGGGLVGLAAADQDGPDGRAGLVVGGRLGRWVPGHREQAEDPLLALGEHARAGEVVDQVVADGRAAPATAAAEAGHPPQDSLRGSWASASTWPRTSSRAGSPVGAAEATWRRPSRWASRPASRSSVRAAPARA